MSACAGGIRSLALACASFHDTKNLGPGHYTLGAFADNMARPMFEMSISCSRTIVDPPGANHVISVPTVSKLSAVIDLASQLLAGMHDRPTASC